MKHCSPPAFLFFVFLLLFCTPAFAQVTGQVADSSQEAIPFCNVLLVQSSDSSVVTGTTADASGNFSLEKKSNGEFRIRIRYTGYKEFFSAPFTLSDAQPRFAAGVIHLDADAQLMKEAVIVAEKPFVEQQLDRVVYNIENSAISAGNNALEVLRKLPGVTVDNSDNIQVRGKSGVQIMIDGRMSQLSGQDIAAYLKTIDASQIQKIEVITNPSAKYDAAGNAIINIVLKKNQQLGLNGQASLNYSQGVYGGANANVNANYRMKKWNFFGNYSHGDGDFFDESRRVTNFDATAYSPAQVTISRQRFHNRSIWNSGRAGVDFMPNDKHTISFVAEASTNENRQVRTFASEFYSHSALPDSSTYTLSPQLNRMLWQSYSLNYLWHIDTTGKELSARVEYVPFTIKSTRQNTTQYYDNNGLPLRPDYLQKLEFPMTLDVQTSQIDYTHPIGTKKKLEAGAKQSYVSTDNNGKYWNVINGEDVVDTTMTNHFLYTETIIAGYVNYSQEISKKLSAQIGFRGEQTHSKGTQLAGNAGFDRSYFNLFPSAFLNWKIDSTHTLNLSYSKRIDRPDYGDLNPFRFYTSPYSYYTGNPYLRPQLSDNFEVTHVYKDAFTIGVGYLHMTDVFTLIPHTIDSSHTFFTRNENFAKYNCYNVLGSFMYPVTEWLTTMTTVNIFHDHYFGPVENSSFDTQGWTWMIYSLNTFSLGKNYGAEVSFFYRSLNRNAVLRENPFGSLDIGVRRKFADGRGMVAINFSDILWTSYLSSSATYPGMTTILNGKNDSRRVHVSLSWKFGRSKYQRQEQQNNEDVIQRAKG